MCWLLNLKIRLALNYIYFPFRRYSDTICDEDAFKAISFESIFTAFIVLAFGIGVAMLSVILEKVWNKPEKTKRNPVRDIGKFAIKKWTQFVHLLQFRLIMWWSLVMEPKGTTRILGLIPSLVFMSAPISILWYQIFFVVILEPFCQRSHYTSIIFPLHMQSENIWVCY